MSCSVVASGSVVLHECDTWSEAVGWLDRYLHDGDGGHDIFEIKKDGVTCAKYIIDRTEEYADDE